MTSSSSSKYIAHSDINSAVARIVRQPEFAASQKLCAFLQFVVGETLAGRQGHIKAFTIATAVYGRDESFDPQTNSIIRVEALRLRGLLDAYYKGRGAEDQVIIQMPRGSYVPHFVMRFPPESANDNPTPASAKRVRPARTIAAFVSALAITIASVFWLLAPQSGQAIERAASVLRDRAGPALAVAAPPEKPAAVQN